ncbi:MAG: cupin domain-containing protein [Candidatus Eremiobacteraeota bacterium]|nr:cupin domain-containing protein [Candidatus Eremiobacteraeota bacterium]
MQSDAPYAVQSVEEVFRSDELRVRRFTLAPGESIPWHLHPSTHDDYYVLAGRLTIEQREPEERIVLDVGSAYRIAAGRPHHNANAGDASCVFLLIQGPGPSTFRKLDA